MPEISLPREVKDLLARYDRESKVFQSDAYGEADTRKEFIEPLFAALGWDVWNKALHSEAYKDVVNEYSLKIGKTHKAPDYAFRIGGTRTFFVEAKRPGVDITKDSDAAYQLRRYGWTAKLSVSVLINFRHIAVYDCTIRPSATDKAAKARTLLIPWSELPARWGELEQLLGKKSVLQGSLDRYASKAGRRRGTSPVDKEFLLQMEDWRTALARNLALRNKDLTVAELNEAVQQTLDRLVFLRIAEDRGIEPYETLKDQIKGKGIYGRLFELFQRADSRYNSGLFHFKKDKDNLQPPDELSSGLAIDDKVLAEIIRGMYYPESPYEFSVLPSDILGQVYEQFLGKVIRLTANHQAIIEEKPEVRRAGGVYYTPTEIVHEIVRDALASKLEGKTPRAALNVKILDPACGSGSFLLGAYDYLLNWFTEAYRNSDQSVQRQALYEDESGQRRLTLAERRKILTSCIFGVDIDRQAVEVTKLSLMLKVLEGESSETMNKQLQMFHVERALPNLNQNIQCGNSLVGTDIDEYLMLTPDEEAALNPLDWSAGFPAIMAGGGFHVVIGNPPYDVIEKERGEASWPHETLRQYLPFRPDYEPALGGKLNLYRLFLVKAAELTRADGRLGMIVPMGLAADIRTTSTRLHLLSVLKSPKLDCFPQKDDPNRRVFREAKLSTLIIAGSKASRPQGPDNVVTTRVFPGRDLTDDTIDNQLRVGDLGLLDPATSPVPLMASDEWELCRRIHASGHVRRLGELGHAFSVTRGEINQTTYRDYIREAGRGYEPMLKGVEVGQFELRASLSQGRREQIDAARLLKDGTRKTRPPVRRIAVQRITGVDERQRLVAALVETPCWFADSTNSIAAVSGADMSLEYLVALLNSDLMQWRFRLTSTNNNVGTNELEGLPIFVCDVDDVESRKAIEEIKTAGDRVANAKAQLATERSMAGKERLRRSLDTAWIRLNASVYSAYGLSPQDQGLISARLTRLPLAASIED
jgi:hypothetical protein